MRGFIPILLLTFIIPASVLSQDRDTELWTGPTFRYNIFNKFRLELEQQVRFFEKVGKLEMTYTELAVRYKIFKFLDAKLKYRYSFFVDYDPAIQDDDLDRQRISLDLSAEPDIDFLPVDLEYRFRFQDSRENITGDKFTYIRNRLEVSYNLSKLVDPFTSAEIFYRFNDDNEFRKVRYNFGLEWRISKKIDLDSYYRFQKEIQVKYPDSKHVIGLMLTYDIN